MDESPAKDEHFGSEHYKEMAKKLRELARQFRFPGARQELLDLAASYERRALHLEGRSCTTRV